MREEKPMQAGGFLELKFDPEKSTGVALPRGTGSRQTETQVQRLMWRKLEERIHRRK